MNRLTRELQTHWAVVGSYLVMRDAADYARAVDQLNELIDLVGTNEDHPLYEFLDTLGTLIERYEDEHHDVLAILPRSPSAERVVKTGPTTFTTRNGPWDPADDPVHSTFGDAVIELCELVFAV